MKAIVPAAGKGTRMVAVTNGRAKELLPLGSRTVLSRILEEARDAGLEGAIVVSSREKPDVEEAIHAWSIGEFADFPLELRFQDEMRGLAHAVWSAGQEDDAVVMVGDVVYVGGSPIERMANLIHRGIDGCIAVEAVEESAVHLYGIVELNEMNGSITRIVEKPKPGETESRWAVAGRWAFSRRAMATINDYCQNPMRMANPKEIYLTEIIGAMIGQGFDFRAVALQPGQERVDCGTPEEYRAATRRRWA